MANMRDVIGQGLGLVVLQDFKSFKGELLSEGWYCR
jgi:hypothetical protein